MGDIRPRDGRGPFRLRNRARAEQAITAEIGSDADAFRAATKIRHRPCNFVELMPRLTER